MALRYLDDRGYSEGVIRDVPSWLLPPGAAYDSLNMIYDRPGVARTRGGTTALSALGSVAGFAQTTGWATASDDAAAMLELMAMSADGHLWRVNNSTGAATDIGALSSATLSRFGRGVSHFGFVAFPGWGPQTIYAARSGICSGVTVSSATGFGNTAAAQTLTAGSKIITLAGGDLTTNIRVGQMVFAFYPSGGFNRSYVGRVTRVTSSTVFNIWPAPLWTGNAAIGSNLTTSAYGGALPNATCAASFQNRLLWGGVTTAAGQIQHDRRFIYSLLPTEEYLEPVAGLTSYTGATFCFNYVGVPGQGYTPYNFVDMPGSDPFVGMEVVSDNELLILGARRPLVFRGDLITQLATTSQQVTFDYEELPVNAGCGSDHTVQRTPKGIMWAGSDGIWLYTGGGRDPVNVLEGRMATYWRGLARSSTFAVHGSAYVRGHYLVTGTSGGSTFALLCNLASREVTFAPQSNLDFFHCSAKPTDPAVVYAPRWWDYSAAVPNFTNGQVIRLESILDAYTAGTVKTDADGAAVAFTFTSRVLVGDPETMKGWQRFTVRYAASMATGVTPPSVLIEGKIDAADSFTGSQASGQSLRSTAQLSITAATNATPIVLTVTVPSSGFNLAVDDFVDVYNVGVNTNANGRWRVGAVTATTITLLGSSGNGVASVAGATVRKVTETDSMANYFQPSQGLLVRIQSVGACDNFELHGLRVAYLEQNPVMSA